MSEEGAECVVLVVEDQKGSLRNMEYLMNTVHDSLAIFSFGAKNISGTSLTTAGKMCPYHAMNFGRVKNALRFLDMYKDYLRFENDLLTSLLTLNHNTLQDKRCKIYNSC